MHWYLKSAELAVPLALAGLAQLYLVGPPGIPEDQGESLKWAILAAERGYQPAKKMVAAYSQVLSASQVEKARKDAQAWVEKYWGAFDTEIKVLPSAMPKP